MRRKGLAMLLTLAMLLGMFPAAALAAGPQDQLESRQEQIVESETVTVDTSGVDLPDNDELFAGYVRQLLYPKSGDAVLFRSYGETALTNDLDKAIYEKLKEKIEYVAANGGSTEFTLTLQDLGIKESWTTSEVGISAWIENGGFTQEAKNAIQTQIFTQDARKIINLLMIDCPYELYWFDKTAGYSSSAYPSASVDGDTLTFQGGLKFSFIVAQAYQESANQYRVSSSKVSAATTAIQNANQIVADNQGKTDYEKLEAYKNEICTLTDYNNAAASGSTTPYGDPWQLIYVFDNDPGTTVVCEGYAKAFQYLCDKSQLTNTTCYTVTGMMSGGTGAGRHMWNIVKMNDQNYLVDVTNSDAGTVGASGGLFLDAPQAGGSMESGYTFTAGNKNITYTYDADIMDLYGNAILTLSETGYQQQTPIAGTVTIDGTPKIGETLTANTSGITAPASGASFTYKWYRDDAAIGNAAGQTYIPVAADAGKALKVEVMAANHSGSVMSAPTAAIEKKDAPQAPTGFAATEVTDTSITVTENADWEYRLGADGVWQTSNTFTNLTANTPYQIYARVAETEDTKPSDASQPLSVTTAAAQIRAVSVTVAAPEKNGIPATKDNITVSEPAGGVTVSSVAWSVDGAPFAGNKFAGGTAYTVAITLTAGADQSFASPTSVTLNTDSAQNITPDGSGNLVLTKIFPATAAKTVAGLTVMTQPTKTEYVAGENFDKTGMVVKATYDDGTTDDNFTGYTVEGGNNLAKGTASVTVKADSASATVAITVKGVLTATDFTYTAPASLIYDGQPKQAQVQANSGITGIGAITVKYNGNAAAPTDAGTYAVTFDVAAGTDYAEATGLSAGTFTIAKAIPTITVNDLTVTINKTAPLGASIVPADLTLSYQSGNDAIATVDQSGNVTGKAVDSTTITVSYAGNSNYNAAEKIVTVTVTDKTPIAVTFADAASKPYTDAGYKLGDQFTAATVGNGIDGKTARYRYNDQEYDALSELPAVTAVGIYTVTAFYEDETYYGEQSATFTITKVDQAQMTISSADAVRFGQTLTLTTEGGSGTGAVTYYVTDGTGSASVSGNVLTPTKAGDVTVTAVKAADANYNEITATQTVTIDKAEAAEAMKTASGTVVAGARGSVTLPALPAGAAYGAVSLGAGTTNDTVVSPSVSGGKLIYTGGSTVAVGTAYTVTVAVNGGDNYNDFTITVTLTGSNRLTPTLTVNPINVTYTGKDVPASAITGTAQDGDKTVSGTWSWGTGKPAPKNVADSGAYEVRFTPDDEAYASGTTTVQVTISKATPTGAPKYTAITTNGKTLADAGLTTTGGTFNVPGTVVWEQAAKTEVAANTAYKWVFTPNDTANYNTLTGSITLWNRSSDSSDTTDDRSDPVSQPSTSGGTSTVIMDVNSSVSGTTASATVFTLTMNTAVERVLNAAEKNGTDPVVVISVDTSSRADGMKVTLPVSSLKTLGRHAYATLTVVSDVAEVTLDSDAISAVTSQAVSTITLYVTPVATSELNGLQKEAVGTAPVFDLSFKSGNTTISDFDGGRVTITLPYTLKSGQTAAGIVVWYMDNNGNLTACDTTYNTSRREVTFTTTHFSKYVIGYEEPEQIWMNPYSDVYRGAWYYDAVQFVTDKGLMNGTAAARFSPDETTTRAMIVTILHRLEGKPVVNYAMRFDDVASGQWYTEAIRWAAANNIVTGYGDGTFGPEDTITREQMAAILYRYAQHKGYSVSTTGSLSGYADANAISNYATAAFHWICGRGIMEGTTTTTLGPAESATRAQVATILLRFCGVYNV